MDGNSLLRALRDLAEPGMTEKYARSIERRLEQNKAQLGPLEEAVTNQKEFPEESEYREKTAEMVELNRRLRTADSNPRNHRYYRALNRIAGEKDADAILGLDGATAIPTLSQEKWNKIHTRLRVERRSGDTSKTPEAITKFVRDAVGGAISEAQAGDGVLDPSAISDDTEAPRLQAANIPAAEKLRTDSPEWLAMSKAERLAYLKQSQGLRTASIPVSSGDPVVNALAELARHDEVFRFDLSQKSSLRAVMAEVFPKAQFRGDDTRPDESRESGADKRTAFSFAGDDGKERLFYIYETDDSSPDVWIDVSRLTEGDAGSGIYAAVGNYAHNTGGAFIGDPAGLSAAATVRRTSAMLSLALRFGTTSFMEPSKSQLAGNPEKGIAPLEWKGNDVAKVHSLIAAFLGTIQSQYPGIKNARYDFTSGQFLDSRNVPIYRGSDEGFDKAAKSERGRSARAGEASLRRGIFLQSLVSGAGGERSDVLGQLLNRGDSVRESGLEGIFTAAIPAADDLPSLRQRGRADFAKARPLIEEAEGHIEDFGAGSLGVNPRFANFGGGNQAARNQVDIVRAYDTFNREIRADRDTFAKAKELLAKDPAGVEELALGAFGEGKPAIADYEQLAIEMFIQQRLASSGDSRQAQIDSFVLIQANILNRRETARTLRIGFDKFMTPEERARRWCCGRFHSTFPRHDSGIGL